MGDKQSTGKELTTRGGAITPTVRQFRNEFGTMMDRFFDSFFGTDWWNSPWSLMEGTVYSTKYAPRLNIAETDDMYNVEIDIAGFNKDDIKLELRDKNLVVSADTSEEKQSGSDNKNYLRRELYATSFTRVVQFPDNVDTDSIDANYNDGIITVSVRKTDAGNPRGSTIEVKGLTAGDSTSTNR